MYCKCILYCTATSVITVLIVAKCIVNKRFLDFLFHFLLVLIVAKCIVNVGYAYKKKEENKVLIVAKCIVNI